MAPRVIEFDVDLVYDQEDAFVPPQSFLTTAAVYRPAKISFAADVVVYPVLSRSEYTAEEAAQSWYSRVEKAEMYEEQRKLVKRMESGKRPKKNSSYRGLENLSRPSASTMDNIIHNCVDAVMDEQDRQWDNKINDWDLIAILSRQVSHESASLAVKLAKYDERQAKKAYKAMEEEEQTGAQDGESSVCTETTSSTMPQVIKERSRGKSVESTPKQVTRKDKKKKKGKKTGPPKTKSSGTRKNLGTALAKLNHNAQVHRVR